SSESIWSTHSWRHWGSAQFFCLAELMYSCWMTRAPYSRQISRVASVLYESATRISSAHLTDSSVARTVLAQLNVGSSTEIGGRLMTPTWGSAGPGWMRPRAGPIQESVKT